MALTASLQPQHHYTNYDVPHVLQKS